MAYTKNVIETKSSIEPVVGVLLPDDNVVQEDEFEGTGIPDTEIWDTKTGTTLDGNGAVTFPAWGSIIEKPREGLSSISPIIGSVLSLSFKKGTAGLDTNPWILIGYKDNLSPFLIAVIQISSTNLITLMLSRYEDWASITSPGPTWTITYGPVSYPSAAPTEFHRATLDLKIVPGKVMIYVESESEATGEGGNNRGYKYEIGTYVIPSDIQRGVFGVIFPSGGYVASWKRRTEPHLSSSGELTEFDLQQSIQPNSDVYSVQELFEGATLGFFENVIHEPIDGVVANPSAGEIFFPKVTTDADADRYMLISKELTDFGTKSGFYTIEVNQRCDTGSDAFSGIAFHLPEGYAVNDYHCTVSGDTTPLNIQNQGQLIGMYISIWWGTDTVITQLTRNNSVSNSVGAITAPSDPTAPFTYIIKINYNDITSKYQIRIYLDDGTQDPKTAILDVEVSDIGIPLRGRVALFQGALEKQTVLPSPTKEKYYVDHIKVYGQVESPLEVENNQGYFYDWGDTDTDGWTIDPTLSHAYYAGEGLVSSEYNYLLYITTRWSSPTEIPSHQFIPGSVWIKNRNPIAVMAAPAAGITNAVTYFNGSLSQDPEGGALTYYFNPGDGSGVVSQTEPLFTHTYTVASNPLLPPPNDTGYDWTFWVEDSLGQLSEIITGTIFIYDSDGLFADVTLMHNPTEINPKRQSSGSNTALPDSEIGLVQRVAGSGRVFSITGYHCASVASLGGDCQASVATWQALAKAEMEFMDMLDKTGQLVKWNLPRYGEIKGFLFNYSNKVSIDSEFIYDYTVELHEVDEDLIGP